MAVDKAMPCGIVHTMGGAYKFQRLVHWDRGQKYQLCWCKCYSDWNAPAPETKSEQKVLDNLFLQSIQMNLITFNYFNSPVPLECNALRLMSAQLSLRLTGHFFFSFVYNSYGCDHNNFWQWMHYHNKKTKMDSVNILYKSKHRYFTNNLAAHNW